jgi:leucyl/phenylalanyl-tRNA--protein transferase
METKLTIPLLLNAYSLGVFPMAEARDSDEIHWIEPRKRGVMPLDGFHVSRSLRRTILSQNFNVTIDQCFADVVQGCADRSETWINSEIAQAYQNLHDAGFAHSLEIWHQGVLTGGVYGVSIGGAFFGESMFSKRPNASKIALAYLVDRLKKTGFVLFDTQFTTPHLISLGGKEVTKENYRRLLEPAVKQAADFSDPNYCPDPDEISQRRTQTS